MQLLCLYIKFFYVFHANVTDFDGVPIEDFVKFVCLREVFVDEVEKGSFNVGSYVSAVGGGVIPDDVSLVVSLLPGL